MKDEQHSTSEHKIERQAVVIIHGMGEQRPMDTLRSFVDGIKHHLSATDPSEAHTVVRSKPDGVSESYETRRLSLSASRKRPLTDFYEFYWAHTMRGTSISDFTTWLIKLITTSPGKVPQRLRQVWYTVFGLVFLTIAALSIIYYVDQFATIKSFYSIGTVAIIVGVLGNAIKTGFLNSVGDAGRYFTPTPGNVGERSNIRQQGIAFLKRLHERKGDQKYDRIIVVAHSLGSVVAYDLLRLLWNEMNALHENVALIDQSAMEEMELYSAGKKEIEHPDTFQACQYHCWQQQRAIGHPWLITDLVTIGAALSHADYLMVSNVTFDQLKEQREFPASPPVTDKETGKIHYNSKPYDIAGGKRVVKLLHHAALFAETRWTNIYFTSDFVGGPMQRIFGKGLTDNPIPRKSLWFWPGGHTNYWDIGSPALRKITEALKLQQR